MTESAIRRACNSDIVFTQAHTLYLRGGVTEFRHDRGLIRGALSDGRGLYRVWYLAQNNRLLDFHCTCSNIRPYHAPCHHVIALMLHENAPRSAKNVERDAAKALLAQLSGDAQYEEILRITPELDVRVPFHATLALSVGITRMYVVRNIKTFIERWNAGDRYEMGKQLSIDPAAQTFSPDALDMLNFAGEILTLRQGGYGSDPRALELPPVTVKRFFTLMDGKPFHLRTDEGKATAAVRSDFPKPAFELSAEDGELCLKTPLPPGLRPLTGDFEYALMDNAVYALNTEAARTLALLYNARAPQVRFAASDAERVVSDIVPALESVARVDIDERLSKRIIAERLEASVYLDRDGEAISARVNFKYGGAEYNPFLHAQNAESGGLILRRDAAGERGVLNLFSEYGFKVRTGGIYLEGEGVPSFLIEGVPLLQALAQVFITDALARMRPRRVMPGGKLRAGRRGMLEFSLDIEGVDASDYQGVLEALLERRAYVRLKDGAVLTLSDEDGWDKTRELISEGAINRGVVEMEQYRAAYLTGMIGALNMNVEQSDDVLALSDAIHNPAVERCPLEGLRPYQERGFSWLVQLARLGMGGILADEMGLGKTLQLIALVEHARIKGGTKPTLVVAPTSLLYNWLAEIERFAPQLKAVALTGGKDARMDALSACSECDMVITTYAQLRRDIETLKDVDFRFIALDEAQHIKNAQTVGANAAKQLSADARFALTGTPMENHPGELWSLFDFILPGYLFSAEEFAARYDGEEGLRTLSRKVRPFLMRRLKTDVLSELPDKIEEVLVCEMSEGQRAVYNATIARAREEIDEAIGASGERARFKILAALTRLRQICCDPGLYLEGYDGGSGKLELLMEIVSEALSEGHGILLFSQFTSMLKRIRAQLDAIDIESLYLDGATPADERMQLVERFNALKGGIFLISLRAGGTGLNLTGADTVIHYDPWWNPAIEDQATDRAHRIGQKSTVHVLRLITRDSIEEKVQKLQLKKREWIESVITPGESLPMKLTLEEIRELFT